MAHKRSAMLEWHLPPLKFILPTGLLLSIVPSHGSQKVYCSSKFCSQKVCYVGIASSTLGLLTQQRPAMLEWQLLPLSFYLARLTKGLQRWNGSFLFKILPSGGSQKVCCLGMALSSSKSYRQGGSQKSLLRLAIKGCLLYTSPSPRDA